MEYLHDLTGLQACLLLCLLLCVEEVGVPLPMLPGDVLLIAGGYLAAVGVLDLGVFVLAAWVAVLAGACCCHLLSRRLGRPAVRRWGRLVGLTPQRVGRAERWLHANGVLAVMVARVLPGTRITMSMAAGCLRLPLRDFVLGAIPSSLVFTGGFALVGRVLGDRVTPLLPWYDRGAAVLAVTTATCAAVWWAMRRLRRAAADPRRADAAA